MEFDIFGLLLYQWTGAKHSVVEVNLNQNIGFEKIQKIGDIRGFRQEI